MKTSDPGLGRKPDLRALRHRLSTSTQVLQNGPEAAHGRDGVSNPSIHFQTNIPALAARITFKGGGKKGGGGGGERGRGRARLWPATGDRRSRPSTSILHSLDRRHRTCKVHPASERKDEKMMGAMVKRGNQGDEEHRRGQPLERLSLGQDPVEREC